MGLRDAEEMLEAAKAQSVIDEAEIARLQRRLAAVRRTIATSTQTVQDTKGTPVEVVETWRIEQVLDDPGDPDGTMPT